MPPPDFLIFISAVGLKFCGKIIKNENSRLIRKSLKSVFLQKKIQKYIQKTLFFLNIRTKCPVTKSHDFFYVFVFWFDFLIFVEFTDQKKIFFNFNFQATGTSLDNRKKNPRDQKFIHSSWRSSRFHVTKCKIYSLFAADYLFSKILKIPYRFELKRKILTLKKTVKKNEP